MDAAPTDLVSSVASSILPASVEADHVHHAHGHHEHADPSWLVKGTNLAAVIIPFIGFIVAAVLLWGVGFSWLHLGLLVGMYFLSAIGITIGYHRLFTHRAFETSRVMKATFAILGSMAVEGPLMKWVAMHRRHHQHSDEPDDPHSPHLHGEGLWGVVTGLFHAHVGWIFDRDPVNLEKYVGDLNKDRALRWISKMFPLWVLVGLLIPTVLGGVISLSWSGALLGLIWGGFARIFLVHHVTWSINSVCHLWGSKDFESHDESRNNLIFGVLALGEGWHNNHHAFPTSARHGLKWWQFDASYLIIAGMETVGLATKVRLPSQQTMAAKRVGGKPAATPAPTTPEATET